MSLLLRFNIIVLVIMISAMILGEIKIMRDIRELARAELQMTARFVDYLVTSKISHLQQTVDPGTLKHPEAFQSLFELKNLENASYLSVEFRAPSGELIDSNIQESHDIPRHLPDWLTTFLYKRLQQADIVQAVLLDGQLIGHIVISANNPQVLIGSWTLANRTLLPLLLLFFIASSMIAGFAAFILKPADKMLLQYRQMGEDASATSSATVGSVLNLKQLLSVNKEFEAVTQHLENHYQQLVLLNEKMLKLQEIERKQLSAELHDELGQHMTALRFDISHLKSSDQVADMQNIADDIDRASVKMLQSLRQTLQRLRPPMLEQVGLIESLKTLINDWQLRYQQHHIHFELQCDDASIDDTRQLILYRLVQEALTNVSRYAGEQVNVWLRLSRDASHISLSIKDDGCGFDPEQSRFGFGLAGMAERMESIGGQMQLNTQLSAGTELLFTIPMTREVVHAKN